MSEIENQTRLLTRQLAHIFATAVIRERAGQDTILCTSYDDAGDPPSPVFVISSLDAIIGTSNFEAEPPPSVRELMKEIGWIQVYPKVFIDRNIGSVIRGVCEGDTERGAKAYANARKVFRMAVVRVTRAFKKNPELEPDETDVADTLHYYSALKFRDLVDEEIEALTALKDESFRLSDAN